MANLHLYQFRFSHFCEKARWGLDFKGLRYQVHSLVAGLHARKVKRLSGQRLVPVLTEGTSLVAGSAAILEHLEKEHPQPTLHPRDEVLRKEALELERWFDDRVGPALRVALFSKLLRDPAYLARLFTHGQGGPAAGFYRLVFPALAATTQKKLRVDEKAAAAARQVVREGLDRVAGAKEGYLAGDAFTLADLTAAALLSGLAGAPQFPYALPQPVSPAMTEWLSEWNDHPGTAWVRRIYRQHRGVFNGFERSVLGTEARE